VGPAETQQIRSELLRLGFKYCSAAEKKIAIFLIASMLLVTLPGHAQSGLNFASAVAYDSGGSTAFSVAVADVNGDGRPDLLVINSCVSNICQNSASNVCVKDASSCFGTVAVLLGQGNGAFQSAVTYSSGGYGASAIAVADVNGDGKLDLLVANQCASICSGSSPGVGSVGVLLGNGDGTFQPVVTYPTVAFFGSALTVADVNGDGKPDLLVTIQCSSSPCSSDSEVGVLLGNGDGTFRGAVTYSSGGYAAESIVVRDVNGDGKPDVLVANQCLGYSDCANGGGVGVLLGNGDGTFRNAVTYSSVGVADSVAVADVNGDGKPDLVVGNYCAPGSACPGATSGTVAVLLGNGDGTFRTAVSYVSGGYAQPSVGVADVNGDGKPDLLVASQCADSACSSNGLVGVLLGNGDGTFQPVVVYDSGGYYAASLAVADVNGDTKPDLVVANQWMSSTNPNNGVVAVLLNTTGVNGPLVEVYPGNLMFAATAVGSTSPPQTVSLTNIGNSALAITNIGITGGGAAAFSESNTCGSGLAPGATCTISVTSTPAAGGSSTATLTITDSAPGSPQTVGLQTLSPQVLLSTGSLTFGAQTVGTTSPSQNVTISNQSGTLLSIMQVVISGDFAQTNNCGTSLAAGGTCQILVTFTPTAAGSRTGSLTINDNAFGSPQTVTLTGTGQVAPPPPAPVVSLTPATVTFPSQYVGTSGLPQTVTVTNTGNATLNIAGASASPGDFGVLSVCNNPVAAGASCTIGVFFDPTASGTRTGALKITDNAGNSPQTVALTGSGLDFSMTPGAAPSATVSAGQTASFTIAVVPAGGFAASVALSCSGGPAGSACAVSPSTIALSGAAAQMAMVTVTTAAHGRLLPFRGGWPRDTRYRQTPMILTLAAMFLLMVVASQFLRRERNLVWIRVAGFAALVTLGVTLTSCGGGSGSGGGGTNPQAGTYTVTVTGNFTSGATTLNHSTKLTLVVQ
jgi:FG-GAP-like repeat/Abnormal spindle-like microcephaly-assoc'd, ASPM-SPD-2-Hydin/FG-GAP repeat